MITLTGNAVQREVPAARTREILTQERGLLLESTQARATVSSFGEKSCAGRSHRPRRTFEQKARTRTELSYPLIGWSNLVS